MENEIQRLNEECDRLREIIGAWRRKAQDKAPRQNEVVKEGYNKLYKEHYKVFVLRQVPVDLDIRLVIDEIETTFIPTVKPFTFRRVDYSPKYKSWLVEVVAKKQYTTFKDPFEIKWSD